MKESIKKRRKVLLVSGSFYPINSPRAFRATELTKELARQGHEVVIYFPTRDKDYSFFERKHNVKVKNLGTLKWKGIEIKGGKIEFLIRKVVRRLLQLLFEWPAIEIMFKVIKVLKHENGYDLLISIAVPYPIHWGVAAIRSNNRRIADCWIADCGDPYMGDTTDSFRKFFYFQYVEKFFCRKANYITIPFEGALSAYYPEFHEKIKVIPQGFQLNKMKIPEYKKVFDYPTFGYAGRFIPGVRDPSNLLDYLLRLKKKFKFIVYTPNDSILLPFKEALGVKMEIREIIPREELLKILSQMDFLLNFDNNTGTQLPSKLIDYSIAGRPVLNITSEMDFSVILEFMNGDYSKKMILKSPEYYDIYQVAEQFIRLQNL